MEWWSDGKPRPKGENKKMLAKQSGTTRNTRVRSCERGVRSGWDGGSCARGKATSSGGETVVKQARKRVKRLGTVKHSNSECGVRSAGPRAKVAREYFWEKWEIKGLRMRVGTSSPRPLLHKFVEERVSEGIARWGAVGVGAGAGGIGNVSRALTSVATGMGMMGSMGIMGWQRWRKLFESGKSRGYE